MRWPFAKRTEDRQDLGERIESLAIEQASVQSYDVNRLSVAEACAGIIGRAFAAARVQGTDILTPDQLEIIGRSLVLRGEYVALITAAGLLVPCASVDVLGRDPDPMRWGYRVQYATPGGGTETMLAGAESVLHVRVGASRNAPWRGRSPLAGAMSDVELALASARAFGDELKTQPKSILGIAADATATLGIEQVDDIGKRIREAKAGRTLVFNWKTAAGYIRADPSDTVEKIRETSIAEIAAAAGVPPVLLSGDGDGTALRESYRRLSWLTIQPMGFLLAQEATRKFGGPVELSFARLRASDEDGRSRAVSRRAAAFASFVAAGIVRDEALQLAGLRDDQ